MKKLKGENIVTTAAVLKNTEMHFKIWLIALIFPLNLVL